VDRLVTGRDAPNSRTVADINAEANIITALICHGDGMQPAKNCDRAVVKTILKHLR
jgi:hypothetical protein